MYKKVSNKLRYFSDILARVINEIEFKIVVKKLKILDLVADTDDQRIHYFSY